MNSRVLIVAAVTAGTVLSGCASETGISNQTTGAVIGSLAGAAVGSAIPRAGTAGVVGGAVVGGLIGYGIGTYLDERERAQLRAASLQAVAAPTGQKINWTTPAANSAATQAPASGYAVALDDPHMVNGRTCRDLQLIAVKDGATHEARPLACQTPAGWDVPES